jgi:hypothetical protein
MRKIYKVKVPVGECQHPLPRGAVPLHAAVVDGEICVWLEVNDHSLMIPQRFVAVGTGQVIPYPFSVYCGTVIDGPHVWHIYKEAL